MTAMPSATSRSISRVNLLLGADVDAARRLVQEEDPRLDSERAPDQDLLLIAAAQRANLRARAREPYVQPPDHLAHVAGLSAQAEQFAQRANRRRLAIVKFSRTERLGSSPCAFRSSVT